MHKIKLIKFAKKQAIITGLAGIVAGLIYSVGGFFVDLFVSLGWITSSETPGLSYGTVLAFLAIPLMPIYFVVFGFVTGLIGGFIYNQFIYKKTNRK
jgi:uncharacterized membrane protein YeaQ/YmgE (transglycosylase-associated protein family)